MRLNVRENVDLVDSTLLEFFVLFEFVDGDNLDGVFLFVVVVDSSVDLTVNSGTDLLVKDVVLYIFYHFKYYTTQYYFHKLHNSSKNPYLDIFLKITIKIIKESKRQPGMLDI